MRFRSARAAVAALGAATLLLGACSSSGGGSGPTTSPSTSSSTSPQPGPDSFNAAVAGVARPSTQTGGTLKLLAPSDCDSWDPQRTYNGYCWNLQRLFTRTLIGYSKVNGSKFELGPDLAIGMGKHNTDYTEWTYTLKPDLKFSDGAPLTAADVQYGISRLWAVSVINGGPASYFVHTIKAPDGYQGPYKGGGVNDVGMTVDGESITFHLTGPDADFNYLLALPAAAPVPAGTEGGKGFVGATYGKHPVASGPFMISSYTPKQQITFVRNPHWTQASDNIRHPLVDKVTLSFVADPTDIDRKLAAGTADANAGGGVAAAFQAQILSNPDLKRNADDPVFGGLKYLAVFPSVLANIHCRKAIFYASDKQGMIRAFGGDFAGQLAGSLSPPGIPGYDESYNPYPTGPDHTGDLAAARRELKACGKPGGFSTKLAYPTPDPQWKNAFVAEQAALGRVGIKVTPLSDDASSYFPTFIGSPRNVVDKGIGIAFTSWGADFPTGTGFFGPIANGNSIAETGNANAVSLNDPAVNKILDQAPLGKSGPADWARLNKLIMGHAVYLPITWGKRLYYRSARMTNVTCNNAQGFGAYDFVNAGVSG